ncbi:NADP-dependent oxidoreductase [Nocardioides sp. JQ2195]|uniref:MDR family NADP-dependent oxidoreductase n=1 Tax=Nocardioides sp. JQ2195 TaxID=2592334 RepID=UPI00143EB4B9|nr:NADP-dependent oxidoreductase [Nocardioides sp. JQ2195]QIX25536.1 NADP-dependent oxidoreductase [Nocardioides sp. JQ2195]
MAGGAAPWEVRLARIPGARIEPDDFALTEGVAPEPAAGEVVVRTEAIGLNAGLRHRLGTGRSTTLGPALGIGDVPRSDGVATVVASSDPDLPEGSRVVGMLPWAGLAAMPASDVRLVSPELSADELLTIRGHVGLTAHVALKRVGDLAPGETVWISAAAGGVGSCAVQFAKLLGGNVIASAGGTERMGFLADELGVDHALDRRGSLSEQLDAAAPDGIDLYLDLVGGDHLELALTRLRERGRAVLVGRTAAHLSDTITLDHPTMIRSRQSVLGMSVTDFPDALPDLTELVDGAAGGLRSVATRWQGAGSLGAAFSALFRGQVLGRAIVEVGNGASGSLSSPEPTHHERTM